jgi:hypothetical protein
LLTGVFRHFHGEVFFFSGFDEGCRDIQAIIAGRAGSGVH